MAREKDKTNLENLKSGQECLINWHEDGGMKACKVMDTFVLYEVPSFGGNPTHEGTFCEEDVDGLLDAAYACA